MSLYRETRGTGPDVALLHGWGLHGGIWHHVAADLEANWRVHLVDLPGFETTAQLGNQAPFVSAGRYSTTGP